MRIRAIPQNTLAGVAALIGPYVPDATPATILQALKAYGNDGQATAPYAQKLLTLAQAAKVMGTSPWTVRRLAIAGKLRATRVGVQWRIPAAAIEELAENHQPIEE